MVFGLTLIQYELWGKLLLKTTVVRSILLIYSYFYNFYTTKDNMNRVRHVTYTIKDNMNRVRHVTYTIKDNMNRVRHVTYTIKDNMNRVRHVTYTTNDNIKYY